MKALTFIALVCVALSACDFGIGVRGYPPPPAGSFTDMTSSISADGVTESVHGATVTRDFFRAYTMQPLLGRLFADTEFSEGGTRTVILSEGFWRKRFGAGPDVIGKVIEIEGAPATVVGVIPDAFQQPANAKFWLTTRK
jgi:hypothetical protein